MASADAPRYTYRNSKKLASGKYRDYWRFRRDGVDVPLPGAPNDAKFHGRYAELMAAADTRKTAQDNTPARHTFAWLTEAYLDSTEYKKNLTEKTQTDYKRTIDDWLVPALGPERFDCITRGAVKLVRDNVAKTLSARTANKVKQVVSLLYTWADDEELLPETFVNPGKKLKKLKGKSKPIEIWSPEEIALFLGNATGTARTAVLLALYTGQRREDLVRMEWADVQGDMLRVRQNKTDEPLTIPCHPELKKHFDTIRTKFGGAILRGQDKGPMNPNQLSAMLNRAVAAITNMPHRTLHGLRYAAAAALEEAGCTVVQIASIVGHRTYQMAMKYASQRREAQAAMAKLEQRA